MPRIKADYRAHWLEKRAKVEADLTDARMKAAALSQAGLGDIGDAFVKIYEDHLAKIDAAVAKL